jgi:acid stress-induced BolA-like protein IbaG/YrbA
MVHEAIDAEMKEIHAVTLKTLTPEEYEKQQQSGENASKD